MCTKKKKKRGEENLYVIKEESNMLQKRKREGKLCVIEKENNVLQKKKKKK